MAILPNEPEVMDARLAFADAQAELAGPVELADTTYYTLGWYGTAFHEERGSFAIVDSEGPLRNFVGDRVLLSHVHLRIPPAIGTTSAYAYVFGSADLPAGWDIAVTRRVFLALALLAADTISVRCEAVAF